MQYLARNLVLSCSLALVATSALAFDSANDSTVDKADRFNFQDFHKDNAQTMWDKDKKKDDKAVTTYDESSADKKPANDQATTTQPATTSAPGMIESETVTPGAKPAAAAATTTTAAAPAVTRKAIAGQTFEKGTELKVREAYKLSTDSSLKNIPTLYEAMESLHRQLNGYCPNGWKKTEEWDLPQDNYFYIHYRAICK